MLVYELGQKHEPSVFRKHRNTLEPLLCQQPQPEPIHAQYFDIEKALRLKILKRLLFGDQSILVRNYYKNLAAGIKLSLCPVIKILLFVYALAH